MAVSFIGGSSCRQQPSDAFFVAICGMEVQGRRTALVSGIEFCSEFQRYLQEFHRHMITEQKTGSSASPRSFRHGCKKHSGNGWRGGEVNHWSIPVINGGAVGSRIQQDLDCFLSEFPGCQHERGATSAIPDINSHSAFQKCLYCGGIPTTGCIQELGIRGHKEG